MIRRMGSFCRLVLKVSCSEPPERFIVLRLETRGRDLTNYLNDDKLTIEILFQACQL